TRMSPVGSATAVPNARGCCSWANDDQWITAPPASGALTHARAPTSAASERTEASRVTARRVTMRSGGSLDGEGNPGRRDPLTAEPGDALLHQIDLQLVRAGRRWQQDLEQDGRALTLVEWPRELGTHAIPYEHRATWGHEVIRGVDDAGLPHRGADVGDRHRHGDRRVRRARSVRSGR